VQIAAGMSLEREPSSLVSRHFAALVALGLSVLAPTLAHADEPAPVAQVEESAGALPAANLARPLHMRDLGSTSSVGLEIDGSTSDLTFAPGYEERLRTGVLTLGGELAVGENFKLFASFPLSATRSDAVFGNVSGHGNLTLGAQVQGSTGPLHLGGGASLSKWGEDDSRLAIVGHLDPMAFMNDGTVLSAFTSAKLGDDDRFAQAELRYTDYIIDEKVGQLPDQQYGMATAGGGLRVGQGLMLLGEVGIVRIFPLTDVEDSGSTVYVADVGVRGRFTPTSPASWAATASVLHDPDEVTTFGVGLELRADLPAFGR
jgi:hypothetical protein